MSAARRTQNDPSRLVLWERKLRLTVPLHLPATHVAPLLDHLQGVELYLVQCFRDYLDRKPSLNNVLRTTELAIYEHVGKDNNQKRVVTCAIPKRRAARPRDL